MHVLQEKIYTVYGCVYPVSPNGNVEDKSVIMQTRQIPLEILKCAITKAIWGLCGALGSTHAAGMTTMIVLTDIMIAGKNNVGILLRFFG